MEASRREFIANSALGTAAIYGCATLASAETASVKEKFIRDYCDQWVYMSIDKLSAYWNDKIEYEWDGGIPIVGAEELRKVMTSVLSGYKGAQVEVLNSFVVGDVVITEQINHWTKKDGGEEIEHVTGLYVVRFEKIHKWEEIFFIDANTKIDANAKKGPSENDSHRAGDPRLGAK